MKMKHFFKNDPSGSKRKYIVLRKKYPKILEQILKWSEIYNFGNLPFIEQIYLFAFGMVDIPIAENGKYKRLNGWKGYSKTGLIEKHIIVKLKDLDIEAMKKKQYAGGLISQKIFNDPNLLKELNDKFVFNISERAKIYMFLNNIIEPPKCNHCHISYCKYSTSQSFKKTCSELCRRSLESRYKTEVFDIEGKKFYTQGYESFVLFELLKIYNISDIFSGYNIIKEIGGPIKYQLDGINREYYPDIFIKSENKIIEVKSSYTYKVDYEKNIAKKEGVINSGYSFEFHIWDLKQIIKYDKR